MVFVRAERRALLGLAIVGLIIVALISLVVIPIMGRVLGEGTSRNPNRPEGEGRDESKPGERGPGGEK